MLLLTLLSLLLATVPVQGGSGLPATITIDTGTAGPGAMVQIAGLDFPGGQTIQLQLTSTAGASHLGTATTAEGGYFRQTVTLPEDVAAGFWELRATAPDGTAAVLIVEAGDVSPALVTSEAVVEVEAGTSSSPGSADILVVLVLLALFASVGGAAAYALRISRRGGRRAGMGNSDDPIWSGLSGEA